MLEIHWRSKIHFLLNSSAILCRIKMKKIRKRKKKKKKREEGLWFNKKLTFVKSLTSPFAFAKIALVHCFPQKKKPADFLGSQNTFIGISGSLKLAKRTHNDTYTGYFMYSGTPWNAFHFFSTPLARKMFNILYINPVSSTFLKPREIHS